MVQSLKSNYENACNAYLVEFCKKHEFDVRDAEWVDIGGVANICDYYVSLVDMMIDIEKDAPRGEYWRYYDYALRCSMLGVVHCNYNNWLRGAPVKSEEQLREIERLKDVAIKAEEALKNAIREW